MLKAASERQVQPVRQELQERQVRQEPSVRQR